MRLRCVALLPLALKDERLIKKSLGWQEVEAPLYFSPAKIASYFHAICPPITTFAYVHLPFPRQPRSPRNRRSSALLNAGYTVSRSHAMAGSIKTNAPRSFVHDVVREWIKEHPVAMKNVKDGSPAKVLLAKEQRCVVRARVWYTVRSAMLVPARTVG